MALLQFGTTLVFGVPPLWNNENQPDPNVRKMQAIVGMLKPCLLFVFLNYQLSLFAGLMPSSMCTLFIATSFSHIHATVQRTNSSSSSLIIPSHKKTFTAILQPCPSLKPYPISSPKNIISTTPSHRAHQPNLTPTTVGILGTIPTLTLAYLTAPFTHQIFLQIPPSARSSLPSLIRFARTLRTHPHLTANTKLEFVTLRIFPFRKHTTAFLHELRALPPSRFRLANIELPKGSEWRARQREKGWAKRFMEVVREPRFKFYVKEGRAYTMKTGVPGVWEEVAQRIKEQSVELKGDDGKIERRISVVAKKPALRVEERIKRQTTRTVRR